MQTGGPAELLPGTGVNDHAGSGNTAIPPPTSCGRSVTAGGMLKQSWTTIKRRPGSEAAQTFQTRTSKRPPTLHGPVTHGPVS